MGVSMVLVIPVWTPDMPWLGRSYRYVCWSTRWLHPAGSPDPVQVSYGPEPPQRTSPVFSAHVGCLGEIKQLAGSPRGGARGLYALDGGTMDGAPR